MQKVYINQSIKEVYKGVSIDAITLPIYVQHTTANTAFSGAILDPTKIRVKATLTRGNDIIDISNYVNLKNLIKCTSLENTLYRYLYGANLDILRAAASDVKELARIPLVFAFGSVINLQGSDTLEVEVSMDNPFAATVDTDESYLQFDMKEGIGVEEYVPVFRAEVVQTNADSQTFTLGDNVMRIVVCNDDKSSILIADQVVTNLSLNSDKVSINDAYPDIYTKNVVLYPNTTERVARYQNFVIHDGKELDKVSMTLNFNGSNVNASKNFVVWRAYKTNPHLVSRAIQMQQKHTIRNLSKVGFDASHIKKLVA